jgi:ComF family protein
MGGRMEQALIGAGGSILNYCLRLRSRVLPPLCLLCAAPSSHANLCDGCRAELPYLPAERCPRCAAPSLRSEVCGSCLAHPPQYDRVLCACAYAFPLDRVIQRFKFAADLAAAPLLAELLAGAIHAADLPDVIVPMPLSDARLQSRGFNQALELARLLARSTGIRLAPRGCVRVRHDEAQSALPFAQRSRNVRGAFVSLQDFSGLAVAVVDDVLTTGATLNEVAAVLRRAGATRVQGWIAARTLPPGSPTRSLGAEATL